MSGAEIVRRWLDAFNRRDPEAMIALQHKDIEFVPITAAMEGRSYSTPAQTREFLRSLADDWEFFECCPEHFYESGDKALALGTWTARGRGSGLDLTGQRGAWLATIRDGKVIRWRTYTEPSEALEAMQITEEELPAHEVRPQSAKGDRP